MKLSCWIHSAGARHDGVSACLKDYLAALRKVLERKNRDWIDDLFDLKPFENAETEAREAIRLKPDYQSAYWTPHPGLWPQLPLIIQRGEPSPCLLPNSQLRSY